MLREQQLAGKKLLVVGCGFGEDAIRLVRMGAQVSAFDLSPDVLAVGETLAKREGAAVNFSVAASERLPYADGQFDVVVMHDIMHHVDIPVSVAELKRVSAPGATWVVSEIYSHTWTDVVRKSWLVDKVLYATMQKFIYRGDVYITADERKLTQRDLSALTAPLNLHVRKWFNLFVMRIVPDGIHAVSKTDRVLLMLLKPIAGLLAGRVIFAGTLRAAD